MATFEITIPDKKIQQLLQGDRGMAVLLEPILNRILQAEMTEHLRPYLLPIPETPDEAFELLLLLELAFDKKTSGPPPETGRDGSASSKN